MFLRSAMFAGTAVESFHSERLQLEQDTQTTDALPAPGIRTVCTVAAEQKASHYSKNAKSLCPKFIKAKFISKKSSIWNLFSLLRPLILYSSKITTRTVRYFD